MNIVHEHAERAVSLGVKILAGQRVEIAGHDIADLKLSRVEHFKYGVAAAIHQRGIPAPVTVHECDHAFHCGGSHD